MIKIKPVDQDASNRKLFIESLSLLNDLDTRSIDLEEKLGISLVGYEETFYTVIENLFKIIFNESQFAVLQAYRYQLVTNEDWDGTITLETNKTETTYSFKTPEEVWDVLKLLKY